MAVFRQVQTDFWQDVRVVEEMTPEDRYFYLYLLTNPHTSQIGIYQIPKKMMAFEMGYSIESINSLMDRFEKHHKLIKYNPETRELAILNWGRYNLNRGGKPMEDCVKKELEEVKDKTLIADISLKIENETIKALFLQHLDDTSTTRDTIRTTISGEEKEEEKEEEEYKDIYSATSVVSDEPTSSLQKEKSKSTPYKEIVDIYNKTCISLPKVQAVSNKRQKKMRVLWRFVKEDIEKIQQLFMGAEQSDFLSGRNGKWSGCNFDWLINQNNALKVLEGTYANKEPTVPLRPNYVQKPSKFVNFKQPSLDFDKLEQLERQQQERMLQEDVV